MNLYVLKVAQGAYEDYYENIEGIFSSIELLLNVSESLELKDKYSDEDSFLIAEKYELDLSEQSYFTEDEMRKLVPNKSERVLDCKSVYFKEILMPEYDFEEEDENEYDCFLNNLNPAI